MKKSEFDYKPSLLEKEGDVVRINFDVEEVEKEFPAVGDEEPIIRKIWEAFVVRVSEPITRSRIIDVIVNAGYPRDVMDAVINNYLLNQKDADNKAEFDKMQEWRAKAKQVADTILSANEE